MARLFEKSLQTGLTLAGISLLVQGQDVHFSQYFDIPLYVNPALVGAHSGQARFTAGYKDQWRAIPAPFNTFAFGVDVPFLQDQFGPGDYAGAGLLVYYDQAGRNVLGLQTTEIRLVGGYSKALGDVNRLSAGFSVSYNFRGVKYDEAQTPNQWDGTRYNPDMPIGETFQTRQFVDMGVGIAWMGAPNQQLKYVIGLTAFHPIRPNVSVVEQLQDRLWTKFGAHVLMGYSFSERLSLLPSIWAWFQGPHKEFLVSVLVKYDLSPPNTQGLRHSIGGGIGTRIGDALYPVVRYEIQNFLISIAYDVTYSPLRQANRYRGGLEVTLSYILGETTPRYQSRYPRF